MLGMHALSTLDQSRARWAVRLLNYCGAWLDKGGLYRDRLCANELLQAAKHRSGFHDFGEGDFFDALSRLLDSCESEGQLNLIGKLALRTEIMRALCNRLSIERDRQCQPEIAAQQIQAPLFILGLPRSGTTLLHTLLACDPAHRAPLTWEVLEPSPPDARVECGRIRRASRCLASLQWLAPTFRQVHAIGAELPQECIGIMSASFLSDQFDTMFNVPSYRAWFLRQDLRPAYELHKRFLQHLQQRRAAKRWILKAPAHMFALPALLNAYGDASFVQTHREPLEAITSVSSMIAILRNVFSEAVDPWQIGHDAIEYWSKTTLRFLADRDELLQGRICDVHYSDIRRDPINVVRRIYSFFDWPLTQTTERQMREHLRNQPRQQHGFHRYHPAQFGLDCAPEAERFLEYCDRFELPISAELERAQCAA